MKKIYILLTLFLLGLSACGNQSELPLDDVEISAETSETVAEEAETSETTAEESEEETSEFTEEITEFTSNEPSEMPDIDDTIEDIAVPEVIEDHTVLTMQNMIEANEISTLLSHYDMLQAEIVLDESEQIVYADQDILCFLSNGYYEGVMNGRRCVTTSGYEYKTSFCLGVPDESKYKHCITLNPYLSNAEIREVTQENDLLYVTAELNERDTAYLLFSLDLEVLRGDTALIQYTLHAEDRSIIEYSVDIQHTDNTAERLATVTVTYDTERPAIAQRFYEHMSLPDTRNITVIVNPDTEQEYTLSEVGIQGDGIQFYRNTNSDHISLSSYEDTDRTADIVIYGYDHD